MDDLKEINEALDKHASRVKEIGEEIRTQVETESAEGKARLDELSAEQKRITDEVAPLLADKEKAEAKAQAETTQKQLEALFREVRSPSKASAAMGQWSASPTYEAGQFLSAIVDLRSGDPEAFGKAKATLEGFGGYENAWGKATLGTTDATGGWIIPNAIVDDLIKPAAVENIYRAIMTVREGVTAFAVDIPFRSAGPNRAVVAAFGATKENVDLTYNGYTATMYTLARIHDIGNQFLRQSQGAAEQDVMSELAVAFAKGESYYIREGSGSSEPFGYTSALTNGPATFRTTFTPSSTTLAGSIARAIADAAGALAGRGSRVTGAVLSAVQYWLMLSQGTDNAGFFFNPAGGPTAINGVGAGVLISPFGIPVFPDAAADVQGTAAVTDNLIVADWKQFKVYFGQSYRVDSSSVAGTRWDTNVTGFRGEEEMGFDARPAVYAGHAQLITDVVP